MMNLVDTITKMNFSRNEYGDFTYTTQETFACRFREINDLDFVSNKEELDADALVHFKAGADVSLGDIFVYNSRYYRVDILNQAKRMHSTATQFIKCGLVRHRQVS